MKKHLLPFLFLFAIFLFSYSENFEYVNAYEKAENSAVITITFDGLERNCYIHVPPCYDKDKPLPLLLMLHGLGGSGEHLNKLTGFNEIADREGFIVACPDGVILKEKELKGARGWRVKDDSDVNYICALTDEIENNYSIDEKKVFVAGMSNGGMLTLLLAAKRPDKFTAAASVMASLDDDTLKNLTELKPFPLMMINGTEDPVIPWDGGDINTGGYIFGKAVSVEDIVKYWVNRNKCFEKPKISYVEDKDPQDGTRVRKEVYTSSHKTDVILYVIEGGGHHWPGSPGKYATGRVCMDINGSEVIWDFFSKVKGE